MTISAMVLHQLNLHVCAFSTFMCVYVHRANGFTTCKDSLNLIDLEYSHVGILYLYSVYLVRQECVHILCKLA